MKLIYKGIFKDMGQLPTGNLPQNAIKFKEPDNFVKLNLYAFLYGIPAYLLTILIVVTSTILHDKPVPNFHFVGIILAFLTVLPHEILHAIGFGKGAEVELYFSPKNLVAFVACTKPVSKGRFIFLSLLPNLVFGWLPLIIWALMPGYGVYSNILYTFSVMGVLFGAGDYMNIFNAIFQMPKGSMQQLSGFNSYWFMP